ncbi:hypothetical protein L6164_033079 [Bauhinia variegata]|uniref:Uncharacterized protein n=1 Tax=Bauhinia variegata TaxID=167791 RepID=A0ACB9KR12_BAUVA|nr:hypothetical protein L6164_033079 [Bauhinia variegata]
MTTNPYGKQLLHLTLIFPLHISPPSTSKSSSLICNSNNTTRPGTGFFWHHQGQNLISADCPSRTLPAAHTELSLGRNFSGGGAEQPPQNNPYQKNHVHFQHSNGTTTTTSTSTSSSSATYLNHTSYGVSLLDVSSDGLRPIKGFRCITTVHSLSCPWTIR